MIQSLKRPGIKCFVCFLTFIALYNIIFYHFFRVWPLRRDSSMILKPVDLKNVVVHIDLKGAPPKINYLRSLLPLLRDNGVTGLLMEYEDMFPYEGILANLSSNNCYKPTQLRGFIKLAVKLGFEVIPLIQTFGHLEFALKHQEFSNLREDPAYPDSICPSKKESRGMIRQMLEQVVMFHANISALKHIHVGCDEVFKMNLCDKCKEVGVSNEILYTDYVRYISKVIHEITPNTRVLIWDDMLRHIGPITWENIHRFKNVEPVYWDYSEVSKFPYVHIMNYDKKFNDKWVATAFKGADGRTSTKPNMEKRLKNHFSWLSHLQTAKIPGKNNVYRFKGIILTGWSRYSHMDPICDLLPVALPSLIANLQIINLFKVGAITSSITFEELSYNHLGNYVFCDTNTLEGCYLYGNDLKRLLNHLTVTKTGATSLVQDNDMCAYDYNFNSIYCNKHHLNWCMESINHSLYQIVNTERKIAKAMKVYYCDDVIKEYVGSITYGLRRRLSNLLTRINLCLMFIGPWGERFRLDMDDLKVS